MSSTNGSATITSYRLLVLIRGALLLCGLHTLRDSNAVRILLQRPEQVCSVGTGAGLSAGALGEEAIAATELITGLSYIWNSGLRILPR